MQIGKQIFCLSKYTKYSVPAEGGMPAIILAGKLTTPQALSAILGL